MKKLALTLLLLSLSPLTWAQGFNAFQQTTFTTVTTGSPIIERSTIGFHQLSWTVSGTVATCTVAIDSSPDGTAWTAGGIIAGQTCTSNGNSTVTTGSAQWIRVNMTAISGAGATVVVTYKGWVQNPNAGTGTTINPTNNVLPKRSNATTFADSALTDNATTVSSSEAFTILGAQPQLTLGSNGGNAGQLSLAGSTSGTSTCTASAVAGTITNPVTCTNDLSAPGYSLVNGAAPASATGMFNTAAQNIIFDSNGTQWLLGNQNIVQANKPLAMVGGNRLFVTANFTTAANTSLQTITGLQFTHTSSNAINWNFHCSLGYSQATGTAAVAFGIQAATNNPTNIFATGKEFTAAGTVTTGVLATLTTTTATAIVSGTPGATGTNVPVELDGTLELAASANTINFMVSTATSADAVTILRGSYCLIF